MRAQIISWGNKKCLHGSLLPWGTLSLFITFIPLLVLEHTNLRKRNTTGMTDEQTHNARNDSHPSRSPTHPVLTAAWIEDTAAGGTTQSTVPFRCQLPVVKSKNDCAHAFALLGAGSPSSERDLPQFRTRQCCERIQSLTVTVYSVSLTPRCAETLFKYDTF